MWGQQVEALQDEFHCLVPDLPGFGESADKPWLSIADAAAQVRALVAARAHDGRAHAVGLSLGGLVALEMLAQDARAASRDVDGGTPVPAIASAIISSALVVPGSTLTRFLARLQLRVWDKRWYWAASSRAFGTPADDRDVFISTGLGISVETERRIVDEVLAGRDLAGLRAVEVPALFVAGGADNRRITRDSLAALAAAAPRGFARLVPGGHHHWNAERPELFTRMVREWVRVGTVADGLEPVPDGAAPRPARRRRFGRASPGG